MQKRTLHYPTLLLAILLFTGCTPITPSASTLSTLATPEAAQETTIPSDTTTLTPEPTSESEQVDGGVRLAEHVEFDSGANSVTHSGTLAAGSDKEYALTAVAGQILHVQTVGSNAPVSFTVYAPGGMAWSGEPQTNQDNTFAAQIPISNTGDYLVTLSMPEADAGTDYDVTFAVEASASQPMTPQPGPAERIDFDPQTGSAQRSGLMPTGLGIEQFVFSVNAGQTMTIDATSDGTPLSMTIESPSGNQWIPEMMPLADGYTIGHQFTLTEPGY